MKVTAIELAGATRNGQTTGFARITRKAGSDWIEVEIATPKATKVHHVQADDAEDVFSMAQCLQERLDGIRGTNSDVHDYYRQLQHFMD